MQARARFFLLFLIIFPPSSISRDFILDTKRKAAINMVLNRWMDFGRVESCGNKRWQKLYTKSGCFSTRFLHIFTLHTLCGLMIT